MTAFDNSWFSTHSLETVYIFKWSYGSRRHDPRSSRPCSPWRWRVLWECQYIRWVSILEITRAAWRIAQICVCEYEQSGISVVWLWTTCLVSAFWSVLIASPGRFFAVNEVKSLLAYTLLNYDITTRDGERPMNQTFQNINMPDMKAEILFRRRRWFASM